MWVSEWAISTIRLYSVIHVDSCWIIQDRRQAKNTDTNNTPEKAHKAKHSKTKLAWFRCFFLRHLARKQGGLILQHPQAITGWNQMTTQRWHLVVGIIQNWGSHGPVLARHNTSLSAIIGITRKPCWQGNHAMQHVIFYERFKHCCICTCAILLHPA